MTEQDLREFCLRMAVEADPNIALRCAKEFYEWMTEGCKLEEDRKKAWREAYWRLNNASCAGRPKGKRQIRDPETDEGIDLTKVKLPAKIKVRSGETGVLYSFLPQGAWAGIINEVNSGKVLFCRSGHANGGWNIVSVEGWPE